jgi:hypothetical protein
VRQPQRPDRVLPAPEDGGPPRPTFAGVSRNNQASVKGCASLGSGALVFPRAECLRHHQTIPPTRTAAARIAKAIQPHCVLLDSSFCDAAAAAAAAAAAGLTPDVVVEPEIVVVGGVGAAATTVVV